MRNVSLTLLTFLLTLTFSLQGCVERKFTVRSDPPGARLYVDYRYRGETPKTIPFQFYGSRAVRLEKSGYQTTERSIELSAPVHSYFPINLFTEVLYPFTIVDHHRAEITLEPQPLPGRSPEETVSKTEKRKNALQRARELKDDLPEKKNPDRSPADRK